jgi:hypothetical protein
VLEQISHLSEQRPEVVQLSDWTALMRLPQPCSQADVVELFYPGATAEALTDLQAHGHQYRRPKFLTLLAHPSYYHAYQYVLGIPEKSFLNIQAMLRRGRKEGKVISQVMCHIVQWVNPHPAQVGERENNKPELWRDLVPVLEDKFEGQAGEEARQLQRRIFDTLRGRVDELVTRSGGDCLSKPPSSEGEPYLDRFERPIWKDILVKVHATVGPRFQGALARFNTEHPESLLTQLEPREPGLTQNLSKAIWRLPDVARNPALWNSQAIDDLMMRISPIVTDWAAQYCQNALTAQRLRKVPPWPPSIMQLVTAEHCRFSNTSTQPKGIKEGLLVDTPLRSSSNTVAQLVEVTECTAEPTIEDTGAGKGQDIEPARDATGRGHDQSSAEEFPADNSELMLLAPDEMEMSLRRRAHREAHPPAPAGDKHCSHQGLPKAPGMGGAEVRSGSLATPLITTNPQVENRRPLAKAKPAQASWKFSPAARSKRVRSNQA